MPYKSYRISLTKTDAVSPSESMLSVKIALPVSLSKCTFEDGIFALCAVEVLKNALFCIFIWNFRYKELYLPHLIYDFSVKKSP